MILQFHKSQYELDRCLRQNTMYAAENTSVHIEETIDSGIYSLKTKCGPFTAKYKVMVTEGCYLLKRQPTPGMILWLIFDLFMLFFGTIVALMFLDSLFGDYYPISQLCSSVYDTLTFAVILILPIPLMIGYILLYSVIPKKRVTTFFKSINSTIPVYNTVPHQEISASPDHMEDNIAMDDMLPPNELKKLRRTVRIVTSLLFIVSIIFTLLIVYFFQKGYPLFAVLFFLADLISYAAYSFFLMVKSAKHETQALLHARPYNGKIVSIRELEKKKVWYYTYRFTDDCQQTHTLECTYPVQGNNLQTPDAQLGTTDTVWYSPDYLRSVFTGSHPEIPKISNRYEFKAFRTQLIIIAVVTAIALFLVPKTHFPDKVGKSLEIHWSNTCKDDGLTQEDVDSDTVQWFLNTYAIRAEKGDNGSLYVIGSVGDTDEDIENLKEYLDDSWGITNRATAIKTLNHVLEHGSRENYKKLIKEMDKDGWFKLEDEEQVIRASYLEKGDNDYRYQGAWHAYTEFGEKGIDAWDYCRVIRVAHECYRCGYISLSEALDQSLPIAKLLQEEFNSWDEINRSYIYGYMFWSRSSETGSNWVTVWTRQNECLQDTKYYPVSPYDLDFNTKLEDTWSSKK